MGTFKDCFLVKIGAKIFQVYPVSLKRCSGLFSESKALLHFKPISSLPVHLGVIQFMYILVCFPNRYTVRECCSIEITFVFPLKKVIF